MLDREHQRDHAALGSAEKADLPQAERREGLRRVPRHVAHRIGGRQLGAPVKDIDRIAVLEGLIGRGYGVRRAHDALDAQAGQDDQRFIASAEAKIAHGKALCPHRLDLNAHVSTSIIRKPRGLSSASSTRRTGFCLRFE